MNSGPTLTNVTFSGNSALKHGGAMYNESSWPVIKDSIFWGNGDKIVYDYEMGSTITDSIVAGGCPWGRRARMF